MPLFYFKAKSGFPIWDTKEPVELLLKHEGKSFWCELGRETGVRTNKQNSSLHLWFDQLAKELNKSGQNIQKVLANSVEIEWSGDLIKELLWRPVQKSITGKRSSTELDKTSEIDEVWEVLNRFVGEKCSVHVPFPTEKR